MEIPLPPKKSKISNKLASLSKTYILRKCSQEEFTEKHLCWGLFIELQTSGLKLCRKRDSSKGAFLWLFQKEQDLRTAFLYNTSSSTSALIFVNTLKHSAISIIKKIIMFFCRSYLLENLEIGGYRNKSSHFRC